MLKINIMIKDDDTVSMVTFLGNHETLGIDIKYTTHGCSDRRLEIDDSHYSDIVNMIQSDSDMYVTLRPESDSYNSYTEDVEIILSMKEGELVITIDSTEVTIPVKHTNMLLELLTYKISRM